METQISQKIEDIRKQFHKEWLLIAVDEMDKATTTPISGRLLAHSPDLLDLYKVSKDCKEPLLMTEYSDEWPEELYICTQLCESFLAAKN
jgi:hypothetical protein